jgi:hypothetical protein
MPFGTIYVPTKEWLDKYKDRVGIWLAFENGNPANPVWLGTTLLDDVSPEFDSYPNGLKFDTEKVSLLIDDVNEEVTLSDSNNLTIYLAKNLLSLLKDNQEIKLEKDLTTLGNKDEEKTEAVRSEELLDILTRIMDMVLDMQTISPVGNNSTGRLDPNTVSTYEQIKADLNKVKSKSVKLD